MTGLASIAIPMMGRLGRAAFRMSTNICRPGIGRYSCAQVCLKYRHISLRVSPVSVHFAPAAQTSTTGDRKSGEEGKSVSVRVDIGGRRTLKKKNNTQTGT